MGIFTLYVIACRGGYEKPSGIVWTATAQSGTSRSHTSNIVPRRLAERVWWTKFQSLLLNICSRLSGFQSSLLLIYFRDGPNRFSLHQSMAQNLSDMWRSTFEIGRPGAASPRHRNRAATTVLVCEEMPFLAWFWGGRKIYPVESGGGSGGGAPGGPPPPPPLIFIWYHFGGGAKSIRHSVILNTAEIIDQLLT